MNDNIHNRPNLAALTTRLFLISVLGLFLELVLIRYVATEVQIFAYLQNVVLVVCFLGLGMGCFTCREEIRFRAGLIPLLVLTLLFAIPIGREAFSQVSLMLSATHDFATWDEAQLTSNWIRVGYITGGVIVTFLLLALIWDMFLPIGRMLGRLFDDHPHTICAYSANVAGSIVGTWLFVALSALNQPPVTWMVVFAGLMFFFLPEQRRDKLVSIALLLAIVVFSYFAGLEPGREVTGVLGPLTRLEQSAEEVRWSPYQKLVLRRPIQKELGQWVVLVNNSSYQEMIDLSERAVVGEPLRYPPELQGLSQYDIPWLFHADCKNVLIVGAGSGNDVAGALRNGAERVTAVEIDPVIIGMGKRYHPEKPYASPKVTIVNDDARSYFATTDKRFDVINFALLDSHTTAGSTTNTRLDHYVYTRESIARAKSLLTDNGVLVLSFYATRFYVADRMAHVLSESFQEKPLVFSIPKSHYGRGSHTFVASNAGNEALRAQIASNTRLAQQLEAWQKDHSLALKYTTSIATDDWPYIYLDQPRIPILFLVMAVVMVVLFLRGHRQLKGSQRLRDWGRTHWHFFCLGAAFMLLEIHNISKASVVLGSTWWVNAVIISGVLIMVLVANAVTWCFPKLPLRPVYAGLCCTCVVLYFVDLASFGFLPYSTKALIVGGLTAVPIAFSGIIFIRSFASVPQKDQAMGANMFGALAGGTMQAFTFFTGIRALLLIVTGLYLLSAVTRPKQVH